MLVKNHSTTIILFVLLGILLCILKDANDYEVGLDNFNSHIEFIERENKRKQTNQILDYLETKESARSRISYGEKLSPTIQLVDGYFVDNSSKLHDLKPALVNSLTEDDRSEFLTNYDLNLDAFSDEFQQANLVSELLTFLSRKYYFDYGFGIPRTSSFLHCNADNRQIHMRGSEMSDNKIFEIKINGKTVKNLKNDEKIIERKHTEELKIELIYANDIFLDTVVFHEAISLGV